jgi:excisionase family DNA binding protein
MSENKVSNDCLFLKKCEVAKMFAVTERTVEVWVRKGTIPALRLGRTIRFDRESIIKHVRDNQQFA